MKRRSLRLRLAVCIGAVSVAAAVASAPAQADGGATGILSGTSEQLPAPLAEPVAEATSTLESVEEALPPVAREAVDEALPPVVQEAVGEVTEAGGGVLDTTLPDTGGATPATGQETAPAAETTPRAETVPAGGSAPTDPALAPERHREALSTLASAPSETSTAPRSVASTSGTVPVLREPRPPETRSLRPESRRPAQGTPAVLSPLGPPVAAFDVDARAPAAPLLPPSDARLPGLGVVPSPAAAAGLVLAAVLALLTLVAPGAGGTLLRSAVAGLRSADVQFRLVRPG